MKLEQSKEGGDSSLAYGTNQADGFNEDGEDEQCFSFKAQVVDEQKLGANVFLSKSHNQCITKEKELEASSRSNAQNNRVTVANPLEYEQKMQDLVMTY